MINKDPIEEFAGVRELLRSKICLRSQWRKNVDIKNNVASLPFGLRHSNLNSYKEKNLDPIIDWESLVYESGIDNHYVSFILVGGFVLI